MKTESFHGTTTKARHKKKYTEIIGSITTLKNYEIGRGDFVLFSPNGIVSLEFLDYVKYFILLQQRGRLIQPVQEESVKPPCNQQ